MRRKVTLPLFMMTLSAILLLSGISAFSQASYSESELTDTVTLNDSELEREAARFGIPASQTKRYVTEARTLNQLYQQGSLTRTEYVGSKRNLIENLK